MKTFAQKIQLLLLSISLFLIFSPLAMAENRNELLLPEFMADFCPEDSRLNTREENAQANIQYEQMCDAGGDALSCRYTGYFYEWDLKNYAKAAKYYEEACNTKVNYKRKRFSCDYIDEYENLVTRSCAEIGRLYEEGKGVKQNYIKAAKYYEKACNKISWSCHELSSLYENGRGVKQDYIKAAQIIEKNIGDGFVYKRRPDGTFENFDTRKIFNLYEKACDSGNPEGCHNLGNIYHDRYPRIKVKDYTKASEYYEKACNAGYTESCSKRFQLLEEICNHNNAFGCNELGILYYKGQSVKQDYNKATQFFEKACNGNNATGCNNLGFLYDDLYNNQIKAKQYYEKACNGNNSAGCNSLGLLYEHDNQVKAKQYYKKACDLGNNSACQSYENIKQQQRMKQEKIREEQEEIRLEKERLEKEKNQKLFFGLSLFFAFLSLVAIFFIVKTRNNHQKYAQSEDNTQEQVDDEPEYPFETKEQEEENDEKDLNRLNPNDPLELQIIKTIQLKRKIPTLKGITLIDIFKQLITGVAGVRLFDMYYQTCTAFIEHSTTLIHLMQTREITQYDIYKKLALLCYQEEKVSSQLRWKIYDEERDVYDKLLMTDDYHKILASFHRELRDIAGKYAERSRDIYSSSSKEWKIKEQEWKKQYEQWQAQQEKEQQERERREKERQEKERREKERQEKQRQEEERKAQEQEAKEWAEFQQWKREKERQERQEQENQERREKARRDYEEYQRAYHSYRQFYEENEQEEENEEENYSSLADEYAAILGVSKNATKKEIKLAYRRKIKEFHPDRHVNAPPEMKERLNKEAQKINKAYEYLYENAPE